MSSKALIVILKFANFGTFECPDPWLIKDPDYKILFENSLAAHYLNYPEFIDHCCRIIAESFKGKGPSEIRRILNIEEQRSVQISTNV